MGGAAGHTGQGVGNVGVELVTAEVAVAVNVVALDKLVHEGVLSLISLVLEVVLEILKILLRGRHVGSVEGVYPLFENLTRARRCGTV